MQSYFFGRELVGFPRRMISHEVRIFALFQDHNLIFITNKKHPPTLGKVAFFYFG